MVSTVLVLFLTPIGQLPQISCQAQHCAGDDVAACHARGASSCAFVRLSVDVCRDKKPYLKAFFVQVAIISNHQNGRDTHIRQIKVFGPTHEATEFHGGHLQFNDPQFAAYACVR